MIYWAPWFRRNIVTLPIGPPPSIGHLLGEIKPCAATHTLLLTSVYVPASPRRAREIEAVDVVHRGPAK